MNNFFHIDKDYVTELKSIFISICKDCAEFSRWKASNPKNTTADESELRNQKKTNLAKLADFLKRAFYEDIQLNALDIKFSEGQGNLAFIPWVILKQYEAKASKGRYISICFDHEGKGAVAGYAMSASDPANDKFINNTTKRRGEIGREKIWKLDVDTPSIHKTQKYNDAFFNPKEFHIENFDPSEFFYHLKNSLNVYFTENSTREYFYLKLGAGIKNNEKPESFKEILRKSEKTVTIKKIINHNPKKGDIAFLVLAGGKHGKPDWNHKAVFSIVEILKKHSLGYESDNKNYYKIDIKTLLWFPENIEYPFFKGRKISVFGEHGEPSQALNSLTSQAVNEEGLKRGIKKYAKIVSEEDKLKLTINLIKDLCDYIVSKDPNLKDELLDIFPEINSIRTKKSATNSVDPKLKEIKDILLNYKRLILHGPPGTGKTYYTDLLKNEFDENEFTVFHPSYGYEDFIGGYRPSLKDPNEKSGSFSIEESKGIFTELCNRAKKEKEKKFLLVIDEINRGDIARIFGELLYGIEAKDEDREVIISYNKTKLTIPNNIYIIGTMNTADKSIALLDVALRRRFAFFAVGPNENLIQNDKLEGVNLHQVFKNLNKRILNFRNKDFEIGHAYFMHPVSGKQFDTLSEFKIAWDTRILPLIMEYFHSDLSSVSEILGSKFIVPNENIKSEKIEFNKTNNDFTIVEFDHLDKFKSALATLENQKNNINSKKNDQSQNTLFEE